MTQASPYQSFPNRLKRDLRAGKKLIGCWSSLSNAITTEVLGVAGFDWILLDGEHSPNDVTTFIPQLMALKDSPSAPVVRPTCNDAVEIKRLLDAGFYNFLIPFVETADDARRAAAATRYPPQGIRRVSVSQRGNRYGTVPDYFKSVNEHICVLVQIESLAAAAAAREMAALDGVDCIFVGPSDLAAGMGHLGNSGHPDVQAVIAGVFADAKACGKPAGILAPVELDARRYLAMGTTFVGVGSDLGAARAQSPHWPSKPIRIVVPYPPGGSSDIIARSMAQPLPEALKQSVIVENKAGANGNLGADYVAKSAPDGYTLLLCDTGALAISPSVYTKLPFDPVKDLRGVTMLAYSPHLLVVHPSVPANKLKELVALSKKTELNFAVTAMGSAPHLAGVAVERASGANWQYIPYKGGSQAITDTIAGQTQILMNGMLATLPFVQSGKLKILGVSKGSRMPLIGNVPTLAEQGLTGFESGTWQGMLVANGTPPAILNRLNSELIKIIRQPDIRAKLAGQGAEVVTMTPLQQDEFFNREKARWAKVVEQAQIKLD